MVVNTHLDHWVSFARNEGVKYISAEVKEKTEKYGDRLKNFFVIGDFNITDTSIIFTKL